MKPQKYVSSIQVGTTLYSCDVYTNDDGKTSSTVNEWIVRSIQVIRGTKPKSRFDRTNEPAIKYVNITAKIEFVTWGKLSTKNGDRGWFKSIPEHAKKQFAVGSDLPLGIYTTPLAAVRWAVANELDSIAWYEKELPKDENQSLIDVLKEEYAEAKAQYDVLRRRLTKMRKENKVTST